MSETRVHPTERPARKRRSDGERSRKAILEQAAQLATVEGIAGLSIGRLAEAVGMSKSGLFAHFGSKEELQLATIETASEVFAEQVVRPALLGESGIERLRLLCERFLGHVENDVFTGGCFFASVAAEMDTHPGPVRDRAISVVSNWMELLETAVADAQAERAIDRAEDGSQLAFELQAFLLLANAQYVITRNAGATARARNAIDRRLAAAAPASREAAV
jgi:AcrR family transcriptional regulator